MHPRQSPVASQAAREGAGDGGMGKGTVLVVSRRESAKQLRGVTWDPMQIKQRGRTLRRAWGPRADALGRHGARETATVRPRGPCISFSK